MAALAFSDLVLMGIALYYWLITDVLTTGWTLWECKMMVWLFHSLITNGTWMVVAMTVDRCIGEFLYSTRVFEYGLKMYSSPKFIYDCNVYI